jgi:hypothetical protein
VIFIPGGTPTEVDATNLKGIYKLALTASEMNHNYVTVGGISATANVAIIPVSIATEGGVLTSGVPIQLGQVGFTPRVLDGITDAALTVGDALVSAIGAGTGQQKVLGTAYTVKTVSGTVIRNFILDAATSPLSRT